MNRSLIILSTAAVLTAASCTDRLVVNGPDDTITVAVGNMLTRTSLDGRATYWTEGDEIKLYDTEGNCAVYEYVSSDSGQATFARKSGYPDFNLSKFAAAYYPAGQVTGYDKSTNTISADIPATQTYEENSFASGSAPMTSKKMTSGTDGSRIITFSNAFAVINVSVFGSGTVSSVELTSDSDALSGNFDFTLTGTNAVSLTAPTFSSGTNNTITLDCGSTGVVLGGTSEDAESFFIALPGNLSNRSVITATIHFDSGASSEISVTVNTSSPSSANYITQNYILQMSTSQL